MSVTVIACLMTWCCGGGSGGSKNDNIQETALLLRNREAFFDTKV